MPVMIDTFSFSISFCTICVATSGLSWLSSRSTCTGTPPSLPPLRSTTIMKASYWSWPSAPCGPDSSAMKPILIGAWAKAKVAAPLEGKGGGKAGLASGHGAVPSGRGG